ncbi:MAG TPA: hypothetical protein DDX91_09805 [Ruminococcaceae bacterium]|nr:hypothetical protein [Oscillospiraceae bacterium]
MLYAVTYVKMAYYSCTSFIIINKKAVKVNIFPLPEKNFVAFTAKCVFLMLVLCNLPIKHNRRTLFKLPQSFLTFLLY